jgi:hypothetical protein
MIRNSIALDSNSYTYLIESIGKEKPDDTQEIGREKIALVKLFFYRPNNIVFYLSPTVVGEYNDINKKDKLKNHISWHSSLFCDMVPFWNKKDIEDRSSQLLKSLFPKVTNKKKIKDCRVVAECEFYGIDTLISFNTRDMVRFAKKSEQIIKTANQYCLDVDFPKRPKLSPHESSPLKDHQWWTHC